jgi:hypothetical protein
VLARDSPPSDATYLGLDSDDADMDRVVVELVEEVRQLRKVIAGGAVKFGAPS